MPFMHPQIQFKAGFFGTFHLISIILCYRHFIHTLDMPGDAECISGMLHDLAWLLSCQDPCPIAEIPSNCQDPCPIQDQPPPNSHPNHILRFWHYATIPLNPDWPLRPLTLYHCPLRSLNDLQDPQLHFSLHYSVLAHLHSVLIFMSLFQSLSFHFWYIAPFQYSSSPILASTLPSCISASLPLNSCNPL